MGRGEKRRPQLCMGLGPSHLSRPAHPDWPIHACLTSPPWNPRAQPHLTPPLLPIPPVALPPPLASRSDLDQGRTAPLPRRQRPTSPSPRPRRRAPSLVVVRSPRRRLDLASSTPPRLHRRRPALRPSAAGLAPSGSGSGQPTPRPVARHRPSTPTSQSSFAGPPRRTAADSSSPSTDLLEPPRALCLDPTLPR